MTSRDETTARGPLTLIRGWALAIIATVPAAALHGGVDGHPPSAVSLLVATTIAAAICVPLVGKKFTRLRSGAAILASQALFHTFFSFAGTGQVTVSGEGTGQSHHGMHGPIDITVTGSGHETTAWMIAAHAVAAFITVGLVWYGETLLRGILGAVQTVFAGITSLAGIARATFATPRPRRLVILGSEPRLIASRVADLMQRRGPPVCA
ncbi:hypothetical protein [Gulosibacter molinativorax]|uniref:Integral membrane protein n=1 Tax=Gulosibacter molinativorax TaxID=256821 RepID=A0ABT7CA40_9MICO|nr:hypothetical protein [Gulosibacter molinativorax]MDJ1371506.1 hypothetical protein [Gulosibacter molinativorax]QUY62448.1 Hypotetical protein [Gulosibacter molinativorax]